MGLFEWGEKRFARGISRAMIHSYILLKADHTNLNERELIKLVLSTRPGIAAQTLFNDIDVLNFWENVADKKFVEVVYILIRMEYVEYMKETLEAENQKTNETFRRVLDEELHKAGL